MKQGVIILVRWIKCADSEEVWDFDQKSKVYWLIRKIPMDRSSHILGICAAAKELWTG
jgi:hypothetical protein